MTENEAETNTCNYFLTFFLSASLWLPLSLARLFFPSLSTLSSPYCWIKIGLIRNSSCLKDRTATSLSLSCTIQRLSGLWWMGFKNCIFCNSCWTNCLFEMLILDAVKYILIILNTKVHTARYFEEMSVVHFASNYSRYHFVFNHTSVLLYVIYTLTQLSRLQLITTIKLVSEQSQTVVKICSLCSEQRGTVGTCVIYDIFKDDS